jgi:hypothetical protein
MMLWLVVGVLVALWLIGLMAKIAGRMIHLVLLVAAIVLVAALLSGQKLF